MQLKPATAEFRYREISRHHQRAIQAQKEIEKTPIGQSPTYERYSVWLKREEHIIEKNLRIAGYHLTHLIFGR